ncbi:endoglucanase V-like protein [Lactifluus volemus]|nr:endoglucanase V-like protein [Lactifluus volemus]
MKAVLIFLAFSSLAVAKNGPPRTGSQGGYVQDTSGNASFTFYSDCAPPACGQTVTGYSAAINQLSFGSDSGPGDACGRCFKITGTHDPYSPENQITPTSIIVRITDECPITGNADWCGQTRDKPTNKYNAIAHFDLCQDSGAADAFFGSGGSAGALTGKYEEVSCLQWQGTESTKFWEGACLAPANAPLWPAQSCGNNGASLFLGMQF